MIIWLNGTFGCGKTSAAAELHSLVPSSRVFDPETVGYMQTILVRAYLEQIFAGLRDAGLDVFHVVLDVGEEVLRQRIQGSVEAQS